MQQMTSTSFVIAAISFILGITATATISCVRWYSAVYPIKEENLRLLGQIGHLNEQIIQLKRTEKFLFNSYCKTDKIRKSAQSDFEELRKIVNSNSLQKRENDGFAIRWPPSHDL